MNTQQTEALLMAAQLRERFGRMVPTSQAAAELERQHARIAELEAQLEAVGAGGVQPLRKTVAASVCSGCGSCQKQCQSNEEQAQAATDFESTHSMSMYASKGDMLRAVMTENERLKQGQANLCQFFAEVCNTLEDVVQGWQDRAIGTTTQRAVEAIKQLAAAQQGVQQSIEQDVRAIVDLLKNREWAEHIGQTELWRELEHEITKLYNATHPTTQGLDALIKALEDLERACDKRASLTTTDVYNVLIELPGMSVALLEMDVARAQARAALAAQAKQGGV